MKNYIMSVGIYSISQYLYASNQTLIDQLLHHLGNLELELQFPVHRYSLEHEKETSCCAHKVSRRGSKALDENRPSFGILEDMFVSEDSSEDA